MSSIDYAPKKRVTWTDENRLGLDDAWVADLVARGYELVDLRTALPLPGLLGRARARMRREKKSP